MLANTKSIQLRVAKHCGFSVASTLFSNDASTVCEFVQHHGAGKVVFKTFSPASWSKDDGGCFATSTSIVPDALLRNADALQSCPGIYQVLVDKKREFRVTVMGNTAHCVELLVGPSGAGAVDWRFYQTDLSVRPFKLPPDIERACIEVVYRLELKFGCIDLIEDVQGDWYFLEVNEMGQFLWIEQINPECHYLAAFTSFVTSLAGHNRDLSGIALECVLNGQSYREIMSDDLARTPLEKDGHPIAC